MAKSSLQKSESKKMYSFYSQSFQGRHWNTVIYGYLMGCFFLSNFFLQINFYLTSQVFHHSNHFYLKIITTRTNFNSLYLYAWWLVRALKYLRTFHSPTFSVTCKNRIGTDMVQTTDCFISHTKVRWCQCL